MGKRNFKKRVKKQFKHQVITEEEQEEEVIPNITVRSEDLPKTKVKWINRQRVLTLASRGISKRSRHLMTNLRTLFPHAKSENKVEKEKSLLILNEISETRHCNKCIYFEQRKHVDLYMWISNVPKGPCAKFLVENMHTMEELKMTGNCLKGSRPLLSFSKNFHTKPHYKLLRELLVQTFSTPNHHPLSQPFFDHVFTFTFLDDRIWFRNYQIVEESGSLVEIGPRFVMNPIKMFKGSFSGQTLWSNQKYISPNTQRRLLRKRDPSTFLQRSQNRVARDLRTPKESYDLDPLDEVFKTELPEWYNSGKYGAQMKKWREQRRQAQSRKMKRINKTMSKKERRDANRERRDANRKRKKES